MNDMEADNDQDDFDQKEIYSNPIDAPFEMNDLVFEFSNINVGEGQDQDESPFEMAIEQESGNGGQDENRNMEIPNELPDHRKTKGGFNQ